MNENEEAKRLGAIHTLQLQVERGWWLLLWAGNESNLEILAFKIKVVSVFSKNLAINQTTP